MFYWKLKQPLYIFTQTNLTDFVCDLVTCCDIHTDVPVYTHIREA